VFGRKKKYQNKENSNHHVKLLARNFVHTDETRGERENFHDKWKEILQGECMGLYSYDFWEIWGVEFTHVSDSIAFFS
jgi:hypothetical protein